MKNTRKIPGLISLVVLALVFIVVSSQVGVRNVEGIVVVAAMAAAPPETAIVPVDGGMASGEVIAVNDQPGDQTDPHVSGDVVVYTSNLSLNPPSIHYYELSAQPVDQRDHVIPADGSGGDTLADVAGSRVAFSRTTFDGTTSAMLFDLETATITEIAPAPGSIRFGTSIGGSTVAFEDFASNLGDIFVSDVGAPAAPPVNLSNSPDLNDVNPSTAPSGDAVVWESCANGACNVWRSIRSNGTWGAAELVATNADSADTDGDTVVYASGEHIYFQPLAGNGAATRLDLPGFQRRPRISKGVISFESDPTGNRRISDLYVYVLSTNTMYRATDTAAQGYNTTLNDISVLPDGKVRLVWLVDNEGVGVHNVYATTFPVASPVPTFSVCLLYDPTRVVRSGSTLAIKIQLCDGNGANQSSPSVVVTAVAVQKLSSSTPPTDPVDTGNANPDSNFRFDPTLGGTGGYVFNLSTRGLSSGTYALSFTTTGASTLHEVEFAVR